VDAKAVAPKLEERRRTNEKHGGGNPLRYVYILESLSAVERFYVGVTSDLKARLNKHNAGQVTHASKFAPWRIKTYIAFSDDLQALQFERYLKTGSGRAFVKKRL